MRFLLFFALLVEVLQMGSVSASTICENKIFRGGCEYYTCREKHEKCGEDGYLLKFGLKKCESFFTKLPKKLSQSGYYWMLTAGECLQRELDKTPMHQSCKKTKKDAWDSHSRCYARSGGCDLLISDMVSVVWHIKKDFKNPRLWKETGEYFLRCFVIRPEERGDLADMMQMWKSEAL